MNDNERLTLIDKLLLTVESYHSKMGKRLSMEERQQLFQCDYDTYLLNQKGKSSFLGGFSFEF